MGKVEKLETVFKHAHVETSKNVQETLAWKMEALKADNLPVDTGLADYVSFAVDNLEGQARQLKAAKDEIARREKAIKDQIESIKVDGAAFLLGEGIDKLDGVICSSVSVTAAKDEKKEEIEFEEFQINIPEDELRDLLIALGKAEMVTKKKEKITKAQPAKLRINKRKVQPAEVVEPKEISA